MTKIIHILKTISSIILRRDGKNAILLDDIYIGTNQVVSALIKSQNYVSPKKTLYFVIIELSNGSHVEVCFDNHSDAEIFLNKNFGNGETK
jgi:hypothetical protein